MNKKEKFNDFCAIIIGDKAKTLCEEYAELNSKNKDKNKDEVKEEISLLKDKLEQLCRDRS